MLGTVLEISVSSAAVILVALALTPLTEKRWSAGGRRVLWLILAVRLLIPFNISLPKAPIKVEPVERVVVFRTDAPLPVAVMTEAERSEAAKAETGPANYAPLFSLGDLLTALWLVGAAAFMLFHLVSYWIFLARVRSRLTYGGEYDGLPYYRCSAVDGPIMVGFFRPRVLLPEAETPPDELEMVLAHERTHLRRGDLWYKLVLLAANAVHWFNPAVWLMARRANKDMEYSCDEKVVEGKDFEFRRRYSLAVLHSMRRRFEDVKEKGVDRK